MFTKIMGKKNVRCLYNIETHSTPEAERNKITPNGQKFDFKSANTRLADLKEKEQRNKGPVSQIYAETDALLNFAFPGATKDTTPQLGTVGPTQVAADRIENIMRDSQKEAQQKYTAKDVPETGKYIIKPGDTLKSIANQLGVDIDVLAKQNNITDKNKIIAGKELQYNQSMPTLSDTTIPVASTAESKPNTKPAPAPAAAAAPVAEVKPLKRKNKKEDKVPEKSEPTLLGLEEELRIKDDAIAQYKDKIRDPTLNGSQKNAIRLAIAHLEMQKIELLNSISALKSQEEKIQTTLQQSSQPRSPEKKEADKYFSLSANEKIVSDYTSALDALYKKRLKTPSSDPRQTEWRNEEISLWRNLAQARELVKNDNKIAEVNADITEKARRTDKGTEIKELQAKIKEIEQKNGVILQALNTVPDPLNPTKLAQLLHSTKKA